MACSMCVCGCEQVAVPGRDTPVTICCEVIGIAAEEDGPTLFPADPKGRYGIVLTRERQWVDKKEFLQQNGKHTYTHTQSYLHT